MAGSNRRFTFAAIALPFLFLVMSGLARASVIIVNTTDGENPAAPLCSLPDAITAHNITSAVHGCAAGDGNDVIEFAVTGTILIDETLEIALNSGNLSIVGPTFGCSGAGPCGITIDGGNTVQIFKTDAGTTVSLNNLTLNHGFATSGIAINTGGGAVYAAGVDLEINNCLFINNVALGEGLVDGAGPIMTTGLGTGGAIYGASGAINILNSTFSNNKAEVPVVLCLANAVCSPVYAITSEGGAIFNTFATLKITNSTIANNTADAGAGVFAGAAGWSSKSNILGNNITGNCGGTNPTDVGFNISSDATCGFTGTSAINLDPLLDPAGPLNNGGPTDTIALEPASPAIDRIPIANCTDQQAIPAAVENDQRLFGRPDPANLNACDSGAYEIDAVAPIMLAGTAKVQVARNPDTANSDKVNIGLTFIYKGDPDCDLGPTGDEDALNFGFGITLLEGTCASLPASGLFVLLEPFVVHTVNHESYGTLFQVNGPEQVNARLLALPTPLGTCGEWTLNLEVSGLDTPALGLGGGNPFAILITDLDDATECFDVTNAIVGQQIPTPPPPAHSVRHRVRRQVRR